MEKPRTRLVGATDRPNQSLETFRVKSGRASRRRNFKAHKARANLCQAGVRERERERERERLWSHSAFPTDGSNVTNSALSAFASEKRSMVLIRIDSRWYVRTPRAKTACRGQASTSRRFCRAPGLRCGSATFKWGRLTGAAFFPFFHEKKTSKKGRKGFKDSSVKSQDHLGVDRGGLGGDQGLWASAGRGRLSSSNGIF